jgi:hypothetical protein
MRFCQRSKSFVTESKFNCRLCACLITSFTVKDLVAAPVMTFMMFTKSLRLAFKIPSSFGMDLINSAVASGIVQTAVYAVPQGICDLLTMGKLPTGDFDFGFMSIITRKPTAPCRKKFNETTPPLFRIILDSFYSVGAKGSGKARPGERPPGISKVKMKKVMRMKVARQISGTGKFIGFEKVKLNLFYFAGKLRLKNASMLSSTLAFSSFGRGYMRTKKPAA